MNSMQLLLWFLGCTQQRLTLLSCVCLSCARMPHVPRQTVTEKHKLNVPETMTEVLDVSDEEGESARSPRAAISLLSV